MRKDVLQSQAQRHQEMEALLIRTEVAGEDKAITVVAITRCWEGITRTGSG